MALHNCKQGHEWINYNNIYKTSLLNITKISMDLSVATWIHSNKAYDSNLQKMNTELRLDHNITGSNKHGKSAKDIRFTDLVKLLDMAETASGNNVQSKKNTCYRNLKWQNKARHEFTKCIEQKSLTDHKPRRTRRYDGNHVNIASFVNRFQTWQKTEHGRNSIMKAFW